MKKIILILFLTFMFYGCGKENPVTNKTEGTNISKIIIARGYEYYVCDSSRIELWKGLGNILIIYNDGIGYSFILNDNEIITTKLNK